MGMTMAQHTFLFAHWPVNFFLAEALHTWKIYMAARWRVKLANYVCTVRKGDGSWAPSLSLEPDQ